ncbi:hypothetical protein ACHAWF_001141, partial [Thalassiosira exigua]
NENDNDNIGKQQSDSKEDGRPTYENPDYNNSPCHVARIPLLLHLTLEECDLSRRMAFSVLLGGFIGYERRASDRPAGIRTMALVALGSCFFTISSQLAFRDSPMTWDASRVTAAIPSGVGFLGAGLIWKGSLSDDGGREVHQVHGITTAARAVVQFSSVWLSAAMGAGAGGALYAVSAYSTALVILVLRFGPRLYLQHDKGFDYDEDEEEEDEDEDTEIESNGDNGSGRETRSKEDGSQLEMGQRASEHATTTLKTDRAKYGATDIEQDEVERLLQGDRRSALERVDQLGSSRPLIYQPGSSTHSQEEPRLLSWLTRLVPGRGVPQPENPYRDVAQYRDIMRSMREKKSMRSVSSRPSFVT